MPLMPWQLLCMVLACIFPDKLLIYHSTSPPFMIRSLVIFLLLNTLSVYLVDQLLDGFVVNGGWVGYLLVGSVIGALNMFVKPILKVLALPFIFLTLGLFVIVINALILWLAQQFIAYLDLATIQFMVEGLVTYLVAVLVLGLLNFGFQKISA